jgi:imidazoleglycerol-phosphate dehydratase
MSDATTPATTPVTAGAAERPRRTAERRRVTKETRIEVRLDLDGSGRGDIATGVPFFDHMLDQLARHGGFDLVVRAEGDVHIDAHHTVEDVSIVVGECLRDALGDKAGVRRFASGLFPLDEALVEVALDLSGRPFAAVDLALPPGPSLGTPPFHPELAEHVFVSLAHSAGITLHVHAKAGRGVHHIVEAAFKGVARCLRDAVRVEGGGVPSTKGAL